jgi:hypothetical protein
VLLLMYQFYLHFWLLWRPIARINVETIAMKGVGGVFCKATNFDEARQIYDNARTKRVLRMWGKSVSWFINDECVASRFLFYPLLLCYLVVISAANFHNYRPIYILAVWVHVNSIWWLSTAWYGWARNWVWHDDNIDDVPICMSLLWCHRHLESLQRSWPMHAH